MSSDPDDRFWGRCKHNVYIGTPGGADFLCSYCETGLDTWTDDPRYALFVGFGVPVPRWIPENLSLVTWRLSELRENFSQVVERFMRRTEGPRSALGTLADTGICLYVEVRQIEAGYWA